MMQDMVGEGKDGGSERIQVRTWGQSCVNMGAWKDRERRER